MATQTLYPPIIDTAKGTVFTNQGITVYFNLINKIISNKDKILIKQEDIETGNIDWQLLTSSNNSIKANYIDGFKDILIYLYLIDTSVSTTPVEGWKDWLKNTNNKSLHSEASTGVRFNYLTQIPSLDISWTNIGRNNTISITGQDSLSEEDFITYFAFTCAGKTQEFYSSLPTDFKFILSYNLVGTAINYQYTYKTFKGYVYSGSGLREWTASNESLAPITYSFEKEYSIKISNPNGYEIYKKIDEQEHSLGTDTDITDYLLEGSHDVYYYNNPDASVINEPHIVINKVFDDMFLLSKNKTLRIRFNPDISSYKRNVADVITATLGGAYPFVRRNGAQKYRTFTINGMISYEGEDLTDDRSLLNEITLLSDDSYDNHVINERKYRDKVLDFLYTPDIKLFKSTQEGNIFVYLSNISLTPEKTLWRSIYSFSCTATEVAPQYDMFKLESIGG